MRRIVLAAVLLCAAAPAERPRLVHAWARPTTDIATTGAAYVAITSPVADRVLSVTSPAARSVEIHVSRDDHGVMQMRRVEQLDLPAGKTVALAPSGYHAMMIGLTRPLRLGQRFPMTFDFEQAGPVTVEVTVEQQPAGAPAPGGSGMPPGMIMDH